MRRSVPADYTARMLPAESIERWLRDAFRAPLPGPAAQNRMAPRPRTGWQPGVVPDGCRPGAGLLLVYPVDGLPVVLLTKRDPLLAQHAGQVSLPGGALDPDETVEQAALREAFEEVGLVSHGIRVIGQLTPLHIPVSQFVLHPVVACSERRPELVARPGEVERLLEPALGCLADSRNYAIERRLFRGQEFRVPYVSVGGEKLWGATAMILAEFLTLLGSPPDPWVTDQRRA
ncbi:MAG TPA: CoA pyrophosphatase [Candidatus Polarisedimenticolaceae bacterium]|nr:CoA pyrophosphatase [Candidatus Polarisedimenticolaceae bacterium]